jgi:phosphotransferase system  glucose/maltose/N-acetylglucosamine-specific IIC component
MQRSAFIAAGLLIVIGAIFVGQGLGILRGSSFMVDDPRWAVIGAMFVVLGAFLGWRARGQRPAG